MLLQLGAFIALHSTSTCHKFKGEEIEGNKAKDHQDFIKYWEIENRWTWGGKSQSELGTAKGSPCNCYVLWGSL